MSLHTPPVPPVSQIIVMPDAGIHAFLDALNRVPPAAGVSIDVNVYELTDHKLMAYLANAAAAGAEVRLILDGHPYDGEREVKTEYRFCRANSQITCKWSPSRFTFDHAKYAVLGGRLACIGTANWTYAAFTFNREFIDCTVDPGIVTAAEAVFQADWTGVRAGNIPRQHLLLAPGAQGPLETFIGQQGQLAIESEELGEIYKLNKLITSHGKSARIIIPCRTMRRHTSLVADWQEHHVQVRCLEKPYLHAKLILNGSRAFLGSENLTENSLERNREVGLLLENPGLVKGLWEDFNADWSLAHD